MPSRPGRGVLKTSKLVVGGKVVKESHNYTALKEQAAAIRRLNAKRGIKKSVRVVKGNA